MTAIAKPAPKAALNDAVKTYELALEIAGGEEQPSMIEAVMTIAANFCHMEQGFRGSFNALGFNQRGIIGQLCQNAAFQVERAEDYEAQESQKLKVLVQQSDGTEISLNNIATQMDRVERIQQVQLPALRDWFKTCTLAYEAIFAEVWTAPVRQGANPLRQSKDALNERLAKMGLKVKAGDVSYEQRTDGTATHAA